MVDRAFPGVVQDPGLTPMAEEHDDMPIDEKPEADDEDAIDEHLNAELIMDVGTNNERRGWVIECSWGQDGAPVGRAHADPLFDTRECDIEFTDGSIERHAANIIAQNMHAQVDSKGHQHLIMDEIVNHEADAAAAPVLEGCCALPNGNWKAKMTARGWKLLVQWKDGSVSWEKSKDLKDSDPIEVAKHAVAD